jgi:hypothetical protein
MLAVAMAPPAAAQTPTDSAPAAAQQPAEPKPVPPTPRRSDESFIEQARQWAKDTQIVERLNGTVDGWYPRLGGLTRGSGFGGGPGYRRHLLGDQLLMDVSAAISTKRYKAVDGHLRWLQFLSDRAEIWTDFRYEDFPQEDFYGLGMNSSESTRTSYGLSSTDIMLRGLVRPVPWVELGARIGYMAPRIGAGHDSEFPSIERVFLDADAPGLADQPNFRHVTVFADIDRRVQRGNPTAGGIYRASFGAWDDRSLGLYEFHRFDGSAMQYFAVTANAKHVVAPRIGVNFMNNAQGSRVPFYFLPYVGGTETVRSLREFRFKDENAMWLGADYLYTPRPHVSLVAFVDAGKVARNWQDALQPTNMKGGYGVGVRVHTTSQLFARMELATGGGEGVRMFVRLGQSF